jgi:hypothetical protein
MIGVHGTYTHERNERRMKTLYCASVVDLYPFNMFEVVLIRSNDRLTVHIAYCTCSQTIDFKCLYHALTMMKRRTREEDWTIRMRCRL